MRPEVQTMLRKTQAFLRGLEATFDEFIARTVTRGEELLEADRRNRASGTTAAQPSPPDDPGL